MERHPFTSTVAREAWCTPVNHGCCMRPARSVFNRTTASSPRMPGRRRSRRCELDAQRRSPARIITGDSAKAASTTVLSFRASPSCGGTTEMCWVKCGCPMGRRQSLMAFKFTRQFSMPGYRFSGLRLQRKRLKTADKESTCRPASTSSGFTVAGPSFMESLPGAASGGGCHNGRRTASR